MKRVLVYAVMLVCCTMALSGTSWAFQPLFSAPVNYGAGDTPYSVFAADLDGDSDADLAVANFKSDNVSILKNNGDGTFAEAVNYGADNGPHSVFAADLDGDTDYDLAVANYFSGIVSILTNNGNGTFAAPVTYTAGDHPHSVFCADLDGDNDKDLAVANNWSSNVSILLNNGNGTFAAAVNYPAGSGCFSVFCADLDGDNDNDLAVANDGSDNVSVLLNNGNGTFAAALSYGTGSHPSSVFSTDLDADSDADLAVANFHSKSVSILKNNGDGTFAAEVSYGADTYPVSVFVADLDGDSGADLVVANRGSNNVSILTNYGDGTFAAAVNYGVGVYPKSVFAADLDGDTDYDLAVANSASDNVSILFNLGVCLEHCGDVDHSGDVSLSDVDFLEDYLYNGFPVPPCYDEADVDDYQLITTHDLIHLREFVMKNSQELTCPPSHSKLSGPEDTTNYLRLVDTIFPANQNTVTLHFNLASSVEIHNLVLPIRIRVQNQIPDNIGNIQISPTFLNWSLLTRHATIDSANGKVLFTFGHYPQNSIGPLSDTEMATVDISMPSSGVDRKIRVDWDPFPPLHNDEYSHYPMLIEPDETAWKPDFFPPTCCIGIRGDVNGSGNTANVADLTYLVDYLFFNGSPPPCMDEGDVNGDGGINVADLTYLVDYLFYSGPPPAPCPY